MHIQGKYAIAYRCEAESSEVSDVAKKCPCLGLFYGMLSTRLIAELFCKIELCLICFYRAAAPLATYHC